MFSPICNVLRLARSPKEEGSEPVSQLLYKNEPAKDFKEPKEDGIDPDRNNSYKSRICKFCR
jgi:hypothetical protein